MDVMALRRGLLAAGKKRLLPPEYQQVEYIESHNGSCIRTEIIPTFASTDDFYLKVAITGDSGTQIIFGTSNYNPGVFNVRIQLVSINLRIRCDISATDNKGYVGYCTEDEWLEFITTGKTAVCLGNLRIISNYTENNIENLILFSQGLGLNYPATCKIERAWYKRNGQAILDLIPCIRKSDNAVGMYDLASKAFLTNADTRGYFTAGQNV